MKVFRTLDSILVDFLSSLGWIQLLSRYRYCKVCGSRSRRSSNSLSSLQCRPCAWKWECWRWDRSHSDQDCKSPWIPAWGRWGHWEQDKGSLHRLRHQRIPCRWWEFEAGGGSSLASVSSQTYRDGRSRQRFFCRLEGPGTVAQTQFSSQSDLDHSQRLFPQNGPGKPDKLQRPGLDELSNFSPLLSKFSLSLS